MSLSPQEPMTQQSSVCTFPHVVPIIGARHPFYLLFGSVLAWTSFLSEMPFIQLAKWSVAQNHPNDLEGPNSKNKKLILISLMQHILGALLTAFKQKRSLTTPIWPGPLGHLNKLITHISYHLWYLKACTSLHFAHGLQPHVKFHPLTRACLRVLRLSINTFYDRN